MKINWGYGIMIATGIFMAFILTLVYKCSKQNIDLVSTNYYEQELKYDEQILKEKNTTELKEDLKINFDSVRQTILIHYPSDTKNLSGEISFIKPDDAKLDFNMKIIPGDASSQTIPAAKMKKGRWNVKVNWNFGELACYHRQAILIN